MSWDINSCAFTGRLTDDPKISTTSNGKTMATFSIAVQGRINAQNNPKGVTFITGIAFGVSADQLRDYGKKGCFIAVSGSFNDEHWVSAGGQKRVSQKLAVEKLRIPKQSVEPKNKPVSHVEKDPINRGNTATSGDRYQDGDFEETNEEYYDNASSERPMDEYDPFEDIPF